MGVRRPGRWTARGWPATIRADWVKTKGNFRTFGNYLNNSIRHAPPPELTEVMEKQYGKPEIIRCWLTLDDMWDYRTGRYNYNFQLGLDTYANDTVKHKYDRGRVTETPYMYYDYIRAFSRHSKKVLLNIRRYEHEVTHGIISLEQWKEVAGNGIRHYKEMCPNICYIEVLNECNWSHFGGLNDTEYYDFYRAVYEIVNELNAEMQPEIPLRVGGTAASGKPLTASDPHEKEFNLSNKAQHLYRFFGHFSKDPDPQKRLDFVSFHEYEVADTPVVLREYEPMIDGWLEENGLSHPGKPSGSPDKQCLHIGKIPDRHPTQQCTDRPFPGRSTGAFRETDPEKREASPDDRQAGTQRFLHVDPAGIILFEIPGCILISILVVLELALEE